MSWIISTFLSLKRIIYPGKKSALTLNENFAWITAGSIIYSGCQWGILVVIAKFGSVKMVGQFALGLAISAPVIMFTNLQLRAVEATDVRSKYKFGDYYGLRLLMTSIAFIIIIALISFGGYQRETAMIVLAVALAKAFESVSDIVYGLMQKHERMDYIGISMALKGLLSLVAFSLVIWFGRNLMMAILGLSVTWLVLLIVYDLSNARMWELIQPNLAKNIWMRLLWLALPLGFVAMLVSLSENIPRYFIVSFRGESDLGYFASMAYVIVAVQKVIIAFGESARPRLAKYFAEKRIYEFRKLLLRMLSFGLLVGIGVLMISIFFGREILTILYRPDYAEHVDVFIWLMIGGGVYYLSLILNDSMIAAQYFRIQVPMFLSVGISIVILCALFIPARGILGAAQALVLGRLIHLLWGIVVCTHVYRKMASHNH